MNNNKTKQSCRIVRLADNKGAHVRVQCQALHHEKQATDSLIHQKPKFLKSSKNIHISTFNIRTFKSDCQSSELVASVIEHDIDIICIQEYRLYHKDIDIKYNILNYGWTLVTASSWKNKSNSSIGGIGLLLSPSAIKSLINVEKISPRIITANFNGNPITTVVSCYSSTNVSDEDDVSEFYNNMSSFTRYVPKHNVLIIAGDFNAYLGIDHDNKFAYHTETNRNGYLLDHFIIENGLKSLNNKFQKKSGKLWTHTHPNGFKSQLDYIIVNNKWINSARNCEAYNTFEGVYSDHRIVTATLKLSLISNKKSIINKKRYDWTTLTKDKSIEKNYTTYLKQHFVDSIKSCKSTNDKYLAFVDSHAEATKKFIPIKIKEKKRVPWENINIIEKRNALKQLSLKMKENANTNQKIEFNKSRQNLQDTYINEQTKYLQKQIDDIKTSADNKKSAIAWQIVNNITGRKTTNRSKTKAKDDKGRIQKWKQHFSLLLGKYPITTNQDIVKIVDKELQIEQGPFTIKELEMVLRKTKPPD